MNKISERTQNSLFWQTIIQPIWEIIRFIISIWIARLLDPKDFGIMAISSVIIIYSNSLSELGFSNALIHKTDITEKHINTVFTINFCISLLLMAIICFFSKQLSGIFNIPELIDVLKVLSLLFIFTSFSQISLTILRRKLEYKRYTIIAFSKGLVQILSTLLLAFLNFKYWSLIIGTIIGELFNAIVLYYNVSMKPKFSFNIDAFKSLYNYGLWNFISAQFVNIYSYAEKAIIGKYLGVSILGLYDKAFSIAFMPIDSIAVKINGVMFSSFNQYKSDEKEMCNVFYKVSVFSSIICFPIYGGLIAVSQDFVHLAFGEKWISMVTSLSILSFAFIFRVPIGLISSMVMAAGDYKKYIKIQILIFLFAIIFYFPAVNYGIEAICVVIALTNFVLFIVSVFLAMKTIKSMSVYQYLFSLIPASINTIIMSVFVHLIGRYKVLGHFSEIKAFTIKVMIGILVYILLFLSIKYKNTEMIRERIRVIRFGK